MKEKNKNRYLITGFSGFVARHFVEYLINNNIHAEVLGVDVREPEHNFESGVVECRYKKLDLLNYDTLEEAVGDFKPDYILHLASYSSVAFSWENPILSFQNNTGIFLNIIESVRKTGIKAKIISVGSSEEYGNLSADKLPAKEEYDLNPLSPYAVARVSQEMFSKIYANSYNLNIIMTRSFNHIGPYQSQIFVISSFVKKILAIKYQKSENLLLTGDLSIVRDFVDVRDVVRAYYLLFERGTSGEIYNICSGKGLALKEIVEKIEKILQLKITTLTDKNLIRPNDNRIIIGSNDKIKAHINWEPQITIDESLTDIINYWRAHENII